MIYLQHPGLSIAGQTGSLRNLTYRNQALSAAGRLLDESEAPIHCRVAGAPRPRLLEESCPTGMDENTSSAWRQELLPSRYSPTSKGFVMKTALGATPNMSWWCQASGTSSPSGTDSCMFMVATGTAPFRIQRASQGISFTCRRGWRWKKRPITWPLLASSAPAMSWAWVAPERKNSPYSTFSITCMIMRETQDFLW